MTQGQEARLEGAIEALRSNATLGELSEPALQALVQKMKRLQVGRGSVVFSYQDDGDALYLLVSGRVKVHLHDADGRELILADLGAGAIFGEMSLLDDCPRSATVTASDTCLLATLSRTLMMEVIQEHPEVAMALLQMLSRRLREADQVIFDLALRDVVERLARLLLSNASPHPSDSEWLVVEGLPSQSEIAARVGASRETISRTIAHFRRIGLLHSDAKGIALTGAFIDRFDHLIGG
jgi:CRP-like cAMP-binding protein